MVKVSGAVKTPGELSFDGSLTLTDVLTMAGRIEA